MVQLEYLLTEHSAAKKAKAAGTARSVDIEERDPHHTEAQMQVQFEMYQNSS
jgi:hypothetical protein